jgi:Ca2+-binding EF-hand superfamily protein
MSGRHEAGGLLQHEQHEHVTDAELADIEAGSARSSPSPPRRLSPVHDGRPRSGSPAGSPAPSSPDEVRPAAKLRPTLSFGGTTSEPASPSATMEWYKAERAREKAAAEEEDGLRAPLPPEVQKIRTESNGWQRTRRMYRAGQLGTKGSVALASVQAMKKSGAREMIRKVFDELDMDNSGFMNKAEFTAMIKTCGGKKRKSREIAEIFRRLDDGDAGTPGEISFEQFESWFLEEMKSDVRAARVLARQLFQLADEDDSGTLSKGEFSHIAASLAAKFPHVRLDPPFKLDKDWHDMCLASADAQGNIPVSQRPSCTAPDLTPPDLDAWQGRSGGVPCPALPCPALPCPALPCPALPCLHAPALACLVADDRARMYVRCRMWSPGRISSAGGASVPAMTKALCRCCRRRW